MARFVAGAAGAAEGTATAEASVAEPDVSSLLSVPFRRAEVRPPVGMTRQAHLKKSDQVFTQGKCMMPLHMAPNPLHPLKI